ncbi:putative methyltransferase [Aeropyrum pernix K1]|uniref:Methyltransferase n=1 Tax=Aeropyrum pernix (strain ATCC 700893 / DSM 11879 / JCM 9820 / NBRC 100138 / K1) TaxID=272557 RepID=Q9YAV9_AERPE|nr:TIGR01177 family methyltransferase [Aeropyrum pernix]BAA80839.1 putative methyltransferase [Aeropyrum pernix K1]
MERFYAILSGESPTLSLEELKAILDVESRLYKVEGFLDGLAIFHAEIDDPMLITSRAAFIKEVGLPLGLYRSSDTCASKVVYDTLTFLEASVLDGDKEFWIDVETRGPYRHSLDLAGLRSRIASEAGKKGFKLSKRRAALNLRIFATEGAMMLGVTLSRLEGRSFIERSPGRRPFFKPGPLSPRLSRAFVNLSRLQRGGSFADPFCGTGGFAIEACLLGASRIACGDLDWAMVRGGPLNLSRYCPPGIWFYSAWNAAKLPLSSNSVDSIATDPPYGRSTTTGRMGYLSLTRAFLNTAVEVLRSEGWIVYAGPTRMSPETLAEDAGLRVVKVIEMFVHGSLTRSIVVARFG